MNRPLSIALLWGALLGSGCGSDETRSLEASQGIARWNQRVDFEDGREFASEADRLVRVFEVLDGYGDPGTATLGEEFMGEHPDHEGAERILIRTADLLSVAGRVDHALRLLEAHVERKQEPSPALRLRLGDAYEAAHRAADAVKVFDDLSDDSKEPRDVYLARFMSSYAKLYGGQETTAVAELERLAAELDAEEQPDLARIKEAAQFQLTVASTWKELDR